MELMRHIIPEDCNSWFALKRQALNRLQLTTVTGSFSVMLERIWQTMKIEYVETKKKEK
jgi:hypothetical protein